MSELKLCPFCGGEAELMDDLMPYVSCCECGVCTEHEYDYDHDAAIDKWNARTESTQLEQVTKERDELKAFVESVASANVQHEEISGPYGGVDEWSFICDSYKDRAVELLAKLNQC